MPVKAYAVTHVGKVRQINEDAYYLPEDGERFAAVADGMGGHQAGEVASAIAIREIHRRDPRKNPLRGGSEGGRAPRQPRHLRGGRAGPVQARHGYHADGRFGTTTTTST